MIRCNFCDGVMRACSPVNPGSLLPAFRCNKCNVRIAICNRSAMPPGVYAAYWGAVNTGTLGRQPDIIIHPVQDETPEEYYKKRYGP